MRRHRLPLELSSYEKEPFFMQSARKKGGNYGSAAVILCFASRMMVQKKTSGQLEVNFYDFLPQFLTSPKATQICLQLSLIHFCNIRSHFKGTIGVKMEKIRLRNCPHRLSSPWFARKKKFTRNPSVCPFSSTHS